MELLRPGQEIVLASSRGAVDCRVLATAGHYVLLSADRPADVELAPTFSGRTSLTYLSGMVPMGIDGCVEAGVHAGELRFRVDESQEPVDRRSSVRVPVFAEVVATVADREPLTGQLLDISAGGLRFRHRVRLAVGSEIRVRTELAGGLVVDADAVIRAAQAGLTSVEFTTMHAAGAAEVGQWTVAVLRAHLARS